MPKHFELPSSEGQTPLAAAMRACEVFCVAACCGMDAFDLTADTMQQWASNATVSDVEQARSEAEAALKSLELAPEKFYYLDCEHVRSEVETWFRTIRSVLMEVQAPDQFGGRFTETKIS